MWMSEVPDNAAFACGCDEGSVPLEQHVGHGLHTRVGEGQHRAAQHDSAHACMPQHTRSSGANHLVALRQPPVNVLHE